MRGKKQKKGVVFGTLKIMTKPITIKDVLEKFDKEFSHVGFIIENKEHHKQFIKEQISQLLDSIVPEELVLPKDLPKEIVHSIIYASGLGANLLRGKLLDNIKKAKGEI